MTDSRLQEFAELLAASDATDRDSLISRAKLLAMNAAAPEVFEAPIEIFKDYRQRDIPIPPILVEPALVVRGGITCCIGRSGRGKRIWVEEKLLTPNGFMRYGDVEVGQEIIDPDGGISNVVGVYRHGVQEVYRLTASDGRSVVCGPEHRWLVNKWKHNSDKIVETQTMVDEGLKDSSGSSVWYLPTLVPQEFYGQDPDIDPYLLGILLGDGGLTSGSVDVNTGDIEVIETLADRLPEGCSFIKSDMKYNPYRWRIKGTGHAHRNPCHTALRSLGLMGMNGKNKFIPEEALNCSLKYRTEVLQGLIDSDGSITKKGLVRFWNSNLVLIQGVQALVRGLGGTAKLASRERIGDFNGKLGTSYELRIRLPEGIQPSKLTRKLERYVCHKPILSVTSIEKIDPVDTLCIEVDSNRHLYVTSDYLVTSNTQFNLNRIMKWACGRPMFDDVFTPDGKPVLNPSGPLKVLIIENEGSAGMFHQQVNTMFAAEGYLTEKDRKLVDENIFVWGDGGYSGLKLDDAALLNEVRAGCEKWKPDIVFIEPFRGLWSGDENSATEMAVVADALSALATDFDCGVILTHHERKSGAGDDGEKMSAGRGSTVLEGVVATMENFESVKDGEFREISWSKIRYGGGVKILPQRMEWQGKHYWYKHVPMGDIEQSILDALAENEDAMTIKEIMQESGEKDTIVRNTLKSLAKEGKVKKMPSVHTGSGSTGQRFRLAVSTGSEAGEMDF